MQRNELYVATMKDGHVKGDIEKVPVQLEDGKLRLQVLFDKSSLEVFVNGGAQVFTTLLFPDATATGLALFAKDGDVKVPELKAWDMGK